MRDDTWWLFVGTWVWLHVLRIRKKTKHATQVLKYWLLIFQNKDLPSKCYRTVALSSWRWNEVTNKKWFLIYLFQGGSVSKIRQMILRKAVVPCSYRSICFVFMANYCSSNDIFFFQPVDLHHANNFPWYVDFPSPRMWPEVHSVIASNKWLFTSFLSTPINAGIIENSIGATEEFY